MHRLVELLRDSPKFKALRDDVLAGHPCQAEGAWGSSYAHFLAAFSRDPLPRILLVTPDFEQAEAALEDIDLFRPGAVSMFPAWDTLPGDDTPPDSAVSGQRLRVIRSLLFPDDDAGPVPGGARVGAGARSAARIIVTPIQALLQPVAAAARLLEGVLRLQVGQTLTPSDLARWLLEREFQRTAQVELPNEFSMRGGILDIYPASAGEPYRVEFFGDQVESIRTFDIATQVSKQPVSQVQILTVRRHPDASSASSAPPEPKSMLADHLPPGSLIAMKEPDAAVTRAARVLESLSTPEAEALNSLEDLQAALGRFHRVDFYSLPADNVAEETVVRASPPANIRRHSFDIRSVTGFGRDLALTMTELASLALERKHTIVFCGNDAERKRLLELLSQAGLSHEPRFEALIGKLNHSFDFRDLGVALLAHHEIFHRYIQRRTLRKRPVHARPLDSFLGLQAGDYVVHALHGIGRFVGMEILEREGKRQEFLAIEYEDDAKLYVPVTKIELVQKYLAGTERRPKLNKLGGKLWERRKEMAARAAQDLAADLLQIQALRAAENGFAFPPDTDWQRRFESEFIYTETEDQLIVADEIRTDMSSPRPMDRLICGDVGYGKTELAIRAAFRAATAGKQVAVLVPTTILADQHHRTFTERMADYPVAIDVLSRFKSRAEQQAILARVAGGHCDVVIGTHRLLQTDVHFKDLGLIIVDEEQRFGVRHKETLKRLKEIVDVLTLTATPIPRTLHMAMLGIRDISSLDTPPMDRLAIQTTLWRFDPRKIRQAILRELARGGQVFFVHNRVQNIEGVARQLQQAVPEARFSIAHGQMPERLLEQRMMDFIDRKSDVLVCTTIIESGLDIPNANTILINRAEMFGLADLHQLRGRVGRYKHRAYCYLLLPAYGPVNPTAEKRLKAIEEFSELGSGYKIAMRDLEIRGAGNILGPEQSGHIEAVGYDMYCHLLDIAVRRMKNEPIPVRHDVAIQLGLQPFLPMEYVPDPRSRMELYRRLNRCETLEEAADVERELRDRFGPIPPEARNLLTEARLRILAQRAHISCLALSGRTVIIESRRLPFTRAVLSSGLYTLRVIDDRTLHLVLPRFPTAGPSAQMTHAEQVAQFLEKSLKP